MCVCVGMCVCLCLFVCLFVCMKERHTLSGYVCGCVRSSVCVIQESEGEVCACVCVNFFMYDTYNVQE